MRSARVGRLLPAPVDAVWDLLVDARNHARWIPLTRVEADGPPALGTRVVAVSGPGARRGGAGLVDRMLVTRFDPPPGAPRPRSGPPTAEADARTARRASVAVFSKLGPVLLGEARLEVSDEDDGSLVVWSETVHLRGWRGSSWLLTPPLHVMLRLALRRAARDLTTNPSRPSSSGL